MNSKIKALLEALNAVTVIDLAMCTRGELLELSDATFEVGGDCDIELESRGAAYTWRQELVPH